MIAESQKRTKKPLPGLALVFLLLASALLALCSISPIGTSSEAREAHIAKVIAEQGAWLLPTRNGLAPSKPPLQHWLAAGLSRIRGVSTPLEARAPSAISAVLCLLLTALMCGAVSKAVFPQRQGFDRTLSLAAVAIVGTTYGFTYMSTDARVDMLCTLCILAACNSILRRLPQWVEVPRPLPLTIRQEDLFWFFWWSAWGTLAKGPLAPVLSTLVVWTILSCLAGVREASRALFRLAWGWGVFLAIAAPWYLAVAIQGAEGVLSRQFVFENLDRFLGGENVNTEPFWFYIPSFLRVALPWSIVTLLVWGREILARKTVSGPQASSERSRRARSLWQAYGWAFLTGFIFFSLASGKRHSYLLPLFPFLGVFLSCALSDWYLTRSAAGRLRLRSSASALAGLLCALVSLALSGILTIAWGDAALLPKVPAAVLEGFHRSWEVYFAVGFCAVLFGARVAFRPCWEAPAGTLASLAISGTLSLALILTVGNHVKNSLKGYPELSEQVNGIAKGEALAVVRTTQDELFDPLLYYLGRPVTIVSPEASAVPCSQASKRVTYVMARRPFFDTFVASADRLHAKLREFHFLVQPSDAYSTHESEQMVIFSCERDSVAMSGGDRAPGEAASGENNIQQDPSEREASPTRIDESGEILGT